MSYGRDEEAENILINTLAKTSYQHELSLGLLKIYADRKDVALFNRVANKVYKFAGRLEDAVIWGKIAIPGLKIGPENPLYQIEDVAQEQSNANQAEFEPAKLQDIETESVHLADFAGLPPLEGFETKAQDQAALNQTQDPLDSLPEPEQSVPSEPIEHDEQIKPNDKSNILEFTLDDINKPSNDKEPDDLLGSDKLLPTPKKRSNPRSSQTFP